VEIDIDASQLQAFGRRYQGASSIVKTELGVAMDRSTLAVEAGAKSYVAVDTHNLQRSITSEVRAMAGAVQGLVGTNSPYARSQEFGHPAGKMPPQGVLLGWMRRHGIDESLEFVIRRKIGRSGYPAKPFMRRALAEKRPAIHREFEQVAARVLAKLRSR
jgi:phage gpG-like protein